MELGDEIFFVVSVAPKAKSGESLGSIGDKKWFLNIPNIHALPASRGKDEAIPS